MAGFRYMLISLGLAATLEASPITDPYVKNLTLVGVIHVEGTRTKGQSVAVLREKSTGKTRILHKGDSIVGTDLLVRELGPQQVTLARGQQTFVLRLDSNSESTMLSQVESTDVELAEEKSENPIPDLTAPSEAVAEAPLKSEVQGEQRRLIPDSDCTGDECPAVTE